MTKTTVSAHSRSKKGKPKTPVKSHGRTVKKAAPKNGPGNHYKGGRDYTKPRPAKKPYVEGDFTGLPSDHVIRLISDAANGEPIASDILHKRNIFKNGKLRKGITHPDMDRFKRHYTAKFGSDRKSK